MKWPGERQRQPCDHRQEMILQIFSEPFWEMFNTAPLFPAVAGLFTQLLGFLMVCEGLMICFQNPTQTLNSLRSAAASHLTSASKCNFTQTKVNRRSAASRLTKHGRALIRRCHLAYCGTSGNMLRSLKLLPHGGDDTHRPSSVRRASSSGFQCRS